MEKRYHVDRIDDHELGIKFSSCSVVKGITWTDKEKGFIDFDIFLLERRDELLYIKDTDEVIDIDFIRRYDYCSFYNLTAPSQLSIKRAWIIQNGKRLAIKELIKLQNLEEW